MFPGPGPPPMPLTPLGIFKMKALSQNSASLVPLFCFTYNTVHSKLITKINQCNLKSFLLMPVMNILICYFVFFKDILTKCPLLLSRTNKQAPVETNSQLTSQLKG